MVLTSCIRWMTRSIFADFFWCCEYKNIYKGRIHTKNGERICKISQHKPGSSVASTKIVQVKNNLKHSIQQQKKLLP